MSQPIEIESVSTESRVFPPPAEFAAKASVGSFEAYEKLYAEAETDPDAFWAARADELSWFKRWDSVLEWNEPFAKWFDRRQDQHFI